MYVIVQKKKKEDKKNISETQSLVSWPELQHYLTVLAHVDPLPVTKLSPSTQRVCEEGPQVNPTRPFSFPFFIRVKPQTS